MVYFIVFVLSLAVVERLNSSLTALFLLMHFILFYRSFQISRFFSDHFNMNIEHIISVRSIQRIINENLLGKYVCFLFVINSLFKIIQKLPDVNLIQNKNEEIVYECLYSMFCQLTVKLCVCVCVYIKASKPIRLFSCFHL